MTLDWIPLILEASKNGNLLVPCLTLDTRVRNIQVARDYMQLERVVDESGKLVRTVDAWLSRSYNFMQDNIIG